MRTDDVGLRRSGARAEHRAPLDGWRRAPDDRRRRLAAARMRREGDVTDLRAALLHPRCSPVGISRCRHSPARTIPPISESAAPDTLTLRIQGAPRPRAAALPPIRSGCGQRGGVRLPENNPITRNTPNITLKMKNRTCAITT